MVHFRSVTFGGGRGLLWTDRDPANGRTEADTEGVPEQPG